MSSNVNLKSILDTNKLTEPNFLNWIGSLRIILKGERLAYVLDVPLLEFSTVDASKEV